MSPGAGSFVVRGSGAACRCHHPHSLWLAAMPTLLCSNTTLLWLLPSAEDGEEVPTLWHGDSEGGGLQQDVMRRLRRLLVLVRCHRSCVVEPVLHCAGLREQCVCCL